MSGKSRGDGPVAKGQHSVFRTKKKESNAAAELPYGGDQFDNTDFRWATCHNTMENPENLRSDPAPSTLDPHS